MPKGDNLTPNQAQFVKQLVDNPKQTRTEAAMKAYNTTNRRSAAAIAAGNMRKPVIQHALAKHNDLFESAIVGTVRDWQHADTPRKREIAVDAAKFGFEHIHGKATVRVEQQSSVVRININLAGEADDEPPEDFMDADQLTRSNA